MLWIYSTRSTTVVIINSIQPYKDTSLSSLLNDLLHLISIDLLRCFIRTKAKTRGCNYHCVCLLISKTFGRARAVPLCFPPWASLPLTDGALSLINMSLQYKTYSYKRCYRSNKTKTQRFIYYLLSEVKRVNFTCSGLHKI